MKRNLMIAVILASVIFAGYLGVARASRRGPENLAESNTPPELSAQISFQGVNPLEVLKAENERAELGLTLSPVPLKPLGIGRTRFMVGLGSYLVNATSGCNGCHTNPSFVPGGNPFQGQPEKVNAAHFLAGGQQFGPFTSRNITPDPNEGNRPAGLTLEEFIHTLRTGEDHDKLHPQFGPLLQVMPWPEFGKMSTRDLEAIYYYLSYIPHAEPGQ